MFMSITSFRREDPSDPKVGDVGRFKTLDHLDGKKCEIIKLIEYEDETMYRVRTLECISASPAGIEYDIHSYEFSKE